MVNEKKIVYRCTKCDSDDVLQDAWEHCNTGEVTTFDNFYCNQCGGECSIYDSEE